MAKPHGFPEKQTWGTWEELVLACAVHRYGSDSWDSVAVELQKRTSTLQQPLSFTPLSCQQKFQDLKRRFSVGGDDDKTPNNNISTNISIPWLDELRKLRVAELRREVQQYDLSIVSLQLKVQKLKEEREQSLIENGKETEKSDLEREKGSEKMEEENEPEDKTRRPVHSREESDRENHSVNESNSTDPKEKSPGTGMKEAKIELEPFEPDGDDAGKVAQSVKPAGGDSCNGSSDSVTKESAENSERVDPRETGDSPESVAESKREEPNRESSDVQSTASLSGKEKKKAEPDKPDHGELDQSPAMKEVSVESQPLVQFLEIFRFHKIGSLFERRLESQETPDYLNLIRQHLDLETIHTRLEEGWYSGCKSKFFRDLLLLLNNDILFFSKESSEFASAIELRRLVSKEIATQFPNPSLLPKEHSSTLPESQTPLKPEPELSLSLTMKTKLSVPLIASRKRSSIAAKSSTSSSGQEKKRQPTLSLMNEKPALDWKQNKSAEETVVTKKRTKERSAPGAEKASKKSKAQNNTNTNKNKNSDSNATTAAVSSKGGSSNENSESKGEKEKTNTNVSSKKKSVANFLNRMRDNGVSTETLLKGSDNSKGGDAGKQKKISSSKGNQQKGRSSTPRTRSSGKRKKEKASPAAKRSTGRPPKRAVSPSAASQPCAGKRGREVENDLGGGYAKKRSRK
ncbi:Detected protein of unknown function [Hibiscus syriacus]|uniref:Bromo domain-containing protein n=1 Tax=Hibiscus syriacus TaxID=106335 RepID=A0A6A2YMQ7_HIBSY|nr:uncharacterized protein LOC120159843 [Hibiscus syriacus]KAE8680597.1 Detected protein of unknown function [Hibiscus syriacus]